MVPRLGHPDAPFIKETSNVTSKTTDLQEGTCQISQILASAHCAPREGRPIPETVAVGPEQGGVVTV